MNINAIRGIGAVPSSKCPSVVTLHVTYQTRHECKGLSMVSATILEIIPAFNSFKSYPTYVPTIFLGTCSLYPNVLPFSPPSNSPKANFATAFPHHSGGSTMSSPMRFHVLNLSLS